MKKARMILEISAVVVFFIGIGWGEQIREVSPALFFSMMFILAAGVISNHLNVAADDKKRISEQAVAKFKQERGIED